MNQKTEEVKYTLSSNLKELRKIESFSEEIARKMNFSEDEKDNLSIAVTEAVGNAIVHGNRQDKRKKVSIIFKLKKNHVKVLVKDEGKGFDPDNLADPLDPQNLMKESGRGIFILKSFVDDVSFSFSPLGTTVEFILEKKDKFH